MYLFDSHWNVYIPGSYGSSLDCRSLPFEESAILEDDEQTSVAPRPSSAQLRWQFLRTCVKDKSMGARYHDLFQNHFNFYSPALPPHLSKPEHIWRVKFRLARLHEEEEAGLLAMAAPEEEGKRAKKPSEKAAAPEKQAAEEPEKQEAEMPQPEHAAGPPTPGAKAAREKGAAPPPPPHDTPALPEVAPAPPLVDAGKAR
jgi:hypothetical protein